MIDDGKAITIDSAIQLFDPRPKMTASWSKVSFKLLLVTRTTNAISKRSFTHWLSHLMVSHTLSVKKETGVNFSQVKLLVREKISHL